MHIIYNAFNCGAINKQMITCVLNEYFDRYYDTLLKWYKYLLHCNQLLKNRTVFCLDKKLKHLEEVCKKIRIKIKVERNENNMKKFYHFITKIRKEYLKLCSNILIA